MIQPKITVSELTLPETRLIWDALQQMSDNRVEDVDGEPIPNPVLDALLEKFDAMFAAPADAHSKEA